MMNSKKSSSNFSMTYFIENIKRFWLGSVFALMGYICVCCLPMVMSNRELYMMKSIVSTSYGPVIMLSIAVPIVAAMLIYRYMQQQSATSIIHSLPYSRKQIFNSGYLSGLLLCLAPVVITGVILLMTSLFGSPVIEISFDTINGFKEINVFSAKAVLLWICAVCLINALVFTVSTFAAVLTGSTLIQGVLSFGLLFAGPSMLTLMSSVFMKFLYGYTTPSIMEELNKFTCPIMGMLLGLEWKIVICYVLVALVLYIISYYLYKSRNMEKATDTLVFDKSKPIFKLVLSFAGMLCFALFLDSMYSGEGRWVFFLGAAVGALITYVAVDMLIQRRIRIKGFIKGFAIYCAVAAAFFALLMFDIIGYESNIPDADDIKGVALYGIVENTNIDGGDGFGFIEDSEIIDRIQSFHKGIIDNKAEFFRRNSIDTESPMPIDAYARFNEAYYSESHCTITYVLNNGKTVKRMYSVPSGWLILNEDVKAVVESDEYKESAFKILTWDEENIHSSSIYTLYEGDICGKSSININDNNRMKQLSEAIEKDIRALKYEDMSTTHFGSRNLFNVEFRINSNDDIIDEEMNKKYYEYYGYYYNDKYEYYEYQINTGYTNTIELLKAWGLYESLVPQTEDIKYVKVTCYENDGEGDIAVKVSRDISDKEFIGKVLNSGLSRVGLSVGRKYEITLYPVNTAADEYFYLYYDEENLPDFVKAVL